MKPILLTAIAIILLAQAGMGQAHRYYAATIQYKATDGCTHRNNLWYENLQGESETFEDMLASVRKYIKPYKLVKGTFKLTSYERISRKKYLSFKAGKFEPCDNREINAHIWGDTVSWGDPGTTSTEATAASIWFAKYDTVKCWLKELVVGKFSNADNGFIKCNESDPGATIFETWQKGYQVLQEHSPTETILAIYSQTPFNTHVCYLYSDRKTKVTNQVIFSIERK